jgi:hypothetical protein
MTAPDRPDLRRGLRGPDREWTSVLIYHATDAEPGARDSVRFSVQLGDCDL